MLLLSLALILHAPRSADQALPNEDDDVAVVLISESFGTYAKDEKLSDLRNPINPKSVRYAIYAINPINALMV